MTDLIERLHEGCVLRPKRWSGDTHAEFGGSVDEAATDALLFEALAALEAAREDAERYRRLRDCHDKTTPDWHVRDQWSNAPAIGSLDAAIDAARKEQGNG